MVTQTLKFELNEKSFSQYFTLVCNMIWLSWLKVAFLCNFIKYFLILSEHQKGGFTFFTTLHYAPELFKIWSYDIIGKTTFSWNESQIFLLTFHECQNSGALCTVFYKNKGTKNKFQLLLPKSLILLRLLWTLKQPVVSKFFAKICFSKKLCTNCW